MFIFQIITPIVIMSWKKYRFHSFCRLRSESRYR